MGVTIQRVLPNTGKSFLSGLFGEACIELGIGQKFARRIPADQWQSRTFHTVPRCASGPIAATDKTPSDAKSDADGHSSGRGDNETGSVGGTCNCQPNPGDPSGRGEEAMRHEILPSGRTSCRCAILARYCHNASMRSPGRLPSGNSSEGMDSARWLCITRHDSQRVLETPLERPQAGSLRRSSTAANRRWALRSVRGMFLLRRSCALPNRCHQASS